jgi:Ca2+-binding EF-hand superfamily protein
MFLDSTHCDFDSHRQFRYGFIFVAWRRSPKRKKNKMGCSSSKVYVVNNNVPGQGPECLELFQKLLFTDSDMNIMFNAFCEFDLTGDGVVSLVEFLTMLQIGESLPLIDSPHCYSEETPITKEIFDEFDGDDKKMDFSEFVLHVWYYCVQDKKKICEMAFDIFDINDNGLLSEDEIKQMVSEIYGARGLHHDLQKIISRLDKNKDGQISRQEFQAATHLFPALLFPAYEIQTIFQQKIGGEAFWRDKTLQAQK